MSNTTASPPARAHAHVRAVADDVLMLHGGVYTDVSGAWGYLADVWLLNITESERSCIALLLATVLTIALGRKLDKAGFGRRA